jgi:hypothetical protein
MLLKGLEGEARCETLLLLAYYAVALQWKRLPFFWFVLGLTRYASWRVARAACEDWVWHVWIC